MLPNVLTGLRILLAPVVYFCILEASYQSLFVAFISFCLACSTDYLDGYVAQTTRNQSLLGEVLDPLADKILCFLTSFSLVYVQRGGWVVFYVWR